MYEPNKMRIKPLPPIDNVTIAKITKITEGVFSDFVEEQYLSSFENPEAECIQLEIETLDNYRIQHLFALPKNENEVSPKSALGKFIEKYESAPYESQEVRCIYSKVKDKTFYQLIL